MYSNGFNKYICDFIHPHTTATKDTLDYGVMYEEATNPALGNRKSPETDRAVTHY